MHEVTEILQAIEANDPTAASRLFPLVYEELRRLAGLRLAQEKPGQTLQATALVHDVYLRLVATETQQSWNSRGHFFGAAAEAMRRILVNRARDKNRLKRGGGRKRVDLDNLSVAEQADDDDLLALDESLERLALENTDAAEFVKLRFFAGMTNEEAAATLGVARRKADRIWAFARAWLYQDLSNDDTEPTK
jgi:RNA polymerase sigma factor (TIGR02999 family)